ncbi:hypothetical protein OIU80_19965 [Flavobacterium sp. LS1R47]|uniref:Uncharacterized protein n=1 Tax=Flavobacterium frigoritolerans TaxID=2987686 RepID=A0A9X3CAG8_9FLAO|nr:hypothetical protein [Flavobacterium frigoritolerans]MCV9934564.1 hypothetical protein [Flavobacterium frigoritolerans]
MSHSEYSYSDKNPILTAMPSLKYESFQISMLVCASDMEKAKTAVKKVLERDGMNIVTKCRIDYLIVGD